MDDNQRDQNLRKVFEHILDFQQQRRGALAR